MARLGTKPPTHHPPHHLPQPWWEGFHYPCCPFGACTSPATPCCTHSLCAPWHPPWLGLAPSPPPPWYPPTPHSPLPRSSSSLPHTPQPPPHPLLSPAPPCKVSVWGALWPWVKVGSWGTLLPRRFTPPAPPPLAPPCHRRHEATCESRI